MFTTAIILGHLAGFLVLSWLIMLMLRKRFGSDRARRIITLIVGCALCAVYITAAITNAYVVQMTDYQLTTDKSLGRDSLRIALISDCHMGVALDGESLARQLERIEEYQPDLLAVAGDLMDDHTTREDMLAACVALGSFDAPMGVYFVPGNHDRGINEDFTASDMFSALKENGVTVLEDEAVLVDGSFWLIGRRDAYYWGREEISALTGSLDDNKYTVVLDHQPTDYAAEAAAGVDLVLSGHTHGGQLLPLQFVLKAMGFCDSVYGYTAIDSTEFIVTSGMGALAVPMRTGTPTEFVIIDITEE